ncbi:hypothetical protein Acsp06_41530 [Actinomycetospora sp. NBRC 106375]|uniref:hypothetical protein n=1 Tax=Actinomycetospora sp. NBRC 106375 TaxID=3032207 RepID=UPI0024A18885|nr:hypothetical protein [Actinomycetospora sp. NBRC 106375]GLZ47968.1 hypothetical protein Acsp06_41530 [Actinomycetospora sp. NBRC 106375]
MSDDSGMDMSEAIRAVAGRRRVAPPEAEEPPAEVYSEYVRSVIAEIEAMPDPD